MKGSIKKLLSMALVFAMIFTISACGGKDQKALDKVNAAIAKTMEKDDSEIDATIKVEANAMIEGMQQEVSGEVGLKVKAPKDLKDIKKMEAAIPVEIYISGTSLGMKIYIKDGWTYIDAMGMKQKQRIKKKDVEEYTNMMEGMKESGKFEIKEEYVNSASMDGDKVILELNLPKIIEAMEGKELQADKIKEVEEAVKELKVEFDIKDEIIEGVKASISMVQEKGDGDEDKEDETVDATIEISYNKIGNIGKIKFPKDLKDYKEMP